jgi:Domain of unknown function (DUF4760)
MVGVEAGAAVSHMLHSLLLQWPLHGPQPQPPLQSPPSQWTVLVHHLKRSAFNEVWFQNLILIVSASIAIITLRATSSNERRRATVDIVRDQQKDGVLIAARATVRNMHYSPCGIDVPALLKPADSPELQAIFTVLNSYEFIATGLKTKAFDKKSYKSMYHNNVVTNWAQLEEFVTLYRVKYREEHSEVEGVRAETLFQDFENLAAKWKKRPASYASATCSGASATCSTTPCVGYGQCIAGHGRISDQPSIVVANRKGSIVLLA